jgi:hypothetical protein
VSAERRAACELPRRDELPAEREREDPAARRDFRLDTPWPTATPSANPAMPAATAPPPPARASIPGWKPKKSVEHISTESVRVASVAIAHPPNAT